MSIYGKFNDSPLALKKEAQEITIKFQRTSDTTARISWNIPPPANGCNSDNQAYDGIVITLSSKPANYLTTSPKDGTYYNGDPTADADIHAGDKLDIAFVVGAFYHDKTTTFLDISDIKPRTPYYISGYAVDNVGRYHREGVHAYSLPTGPDEQVSEDIEARHDIGIESSVGVYPNDPTGLIKSSNYTFKINLSSVTHTITIRGVDALTYKDLVKAINKEFTKLEGPFKSPVPANADNYYWDEVNKSLFYWDGFINRELDYISSEDDPSQPAIGAYWYNPVTSILYIYETAGWVEVTNLIKLSVDPTELSCGQMWFNGEDVWEWDGNHWDKLCVYIQNRNPLLAPILSCNTYWYDVANSELFKWDAEFKKWNDALAIYHVTDPNLINTGDFWYDETASKVKQYVGSSWNILTNLWYEEAVGGEFPDSEIVTASMYWFVPSTGKLYQRDLMNIEWVEQVIVSFPTDPMDRASCDLWWDATNDVLNAWDELNSQWVQVELFNQTAVDPSSPPEIPECAVWYNPDDNTLQKIIGLNCSLVEFIRAEDDPTNLPYGYVWQNGDVFMLWDGDSWITITPYSESSNPFDLSVGEVWYVPSTNSLYKWNGTEWESLEYSSIPLVPKVGALWFNTLDEILLKWSGSSWVPSEALVQAEFIQRTKADGKDIIRFSTRDKGCAERFFIVVESGTLFTHLVNSVIYYDPVAGNSGVLDVPMYKQLGVGDDGSPDERRLLHDSVRIALGHPTVQVELTKEQLDECLDNALLVLRKRSNISYKNAMFFLTLQPNQQIYVLSNKCVGFHKIVSIKSIHRVRAGAFKHAYALNDNFSYAALQQMYRVGTFDMLTYHMSASYIEEMERLFASKILFQWIERTRELKLYQTVGGVEKVLVDAVIERTEQDLFTDRESRLWIKRWAIAEAKMMLSQIRGKFQSLPGPTGSTTLNSQELITQGEAEKAQLDAELDDMLMQDAIDIGMRSHFILG